jgi:hypothetical protein
MAYGVVHELKGRLRAGYLPVFSSDGLKHYYYALTVHFGSWANQGGKKPVWVLMGDLLYGQVIQHPRRRKTVDLEWRILWRGGRGVSKGAEGKRAERADHHFVIERLYMTIRKCVS